MRRDRIGLVILFQFALLAIDVVLNVLTDLHRGSPVTLLLLFIIQDFCIVLSLLVMCLTIFNTYAFQVGEFREVAATFKTPVAVNFIYLVLSLVLHVWSMEMNEDGSSEQLRHSWRTRATDVTLFTLQRFAGVWHYYFYKKTALFMADDRLYRPSGRSAATKCSAATAEEPM
ncbi:transmembrane protein 138-like [Rhipicephalus sanguineus]|uniref:transmembrane protein 138-like n=1 Tax=Rhipicephalus sanguineus TaxID=34632 RepID=UPI0018933955|nr:transmembrane protein 138-like [Rhipicephalus sanguineus]